MRNHVLITGSTRGIGFALSREFLKLGWAVTISGVSGGSVEKALNALKGEFPESELFGQAADVASLSALRVLRDQSEQVLGQIHCWINNAGVDQRRCFSWELEEREFDRIAETNLGGVFRGCKAALESMLAVGEGVLLNMEGFGSNGMIGSKIGIYGTTKRGVRYFTKTLIREVAEYKAPGVFVGTLSPGMVVTDLLLSGISAESGEAERIKRVYNILADKPETVAPFLVKRIIKIKRTGAKIEWLTTGKVFRRFITAPFIKRKIL